MLTIEQLCAYGADVATTTSTEKDISMSMTKVNSVVDGFKNPKGGVNVSHGTHGHKRMSQSAAPGVPKKGCC